MGRVGYWGELAVGQIDCKSLGHFSYKMDLSTALILKYDGTDDLSGPSCIVRGPLSDKME